MLSISAPIETARLRLRPFVDDDLSGLHAIHSDPEVVRYLYWEPRSREQVAEILAQRKHSTRIATKNDVIVLAVERIAGARVIGEVTLALRSVEHRQAEIGFVFDPNAGEPLTIERKGALAQLFGTQMMRGPAFFEHHEELHRSVLEGLKESDLKPKHLAAVGGDLDLARRQVIDVHLDSTYRLVTMLTYAIKVAGILSLMRWQVLRFKGPLLAYSDHPVVLWPMNVDRARPFPRQGLGPLTMLEVRVPIAPDAAVLMNWIDQSDEVGVPMKRRAAAELNAFTISQAQAEWMHRPGVKPELVDDIFSPLSRFIDPTYDRATAEWSVRRAHAQKFHDRAKKRKWVNELDVVVDVGSQPSLRAAA